MSTAKLTHPDVIEDSLELQRLILSLHGRGVQTITPIDELNDVTSGAAYCQVVLRAQILQGLHQTPLSRARQDHHQCVRSDVCSRFDAFFVLNIIFM